MTDKEISSRSILFLIIGMLLVLSLVICIYIVSKEKDLVKVSANVIDVKEDQDGTGKNDVTVRYEVNDVSYEYNFYYKDDIKEDDVINIYYHENDVDSVQPYKTSKLIFICPVIGLILCVYGLIELFTKFKESLDTSDVETKVISEDENTQQLKIIVDNTDDDIEMKDNTEEVVPIKSIKEKDSVVSKEDEIVIEEDIFNTKEIENVVDLVEDETKEIKVPVEVKPKNYYVSGNSLVYEIDKNNSQEINFSDVKEVEKVLGVKDKIIEIKIYTDEVICVLNKMKNIDLEKMMNTIHNKMLVVDETFNETILYDDEV